MIYNDLMNTMINVIRHCGLDPQSLSGERLRVKPAMTTLFFNDGMGERKNLGNLENLGEIVVQDKKQIEFRSTETDSKRQILKKKL